MCYLGSCMAYVPHRAEVCVVGNSVTPVDPSEYIPCAASFAYWPQTKAEHMNQGWPIYICVPCLALWMFPPYDL